MIHLTSQTYLFYWIFDEIHVTQHFHMLFWIVLIDLLYFADIVELIHVVYPI